MVRIAKWVLPAAVLMLLAFAGGFVLFATSVAEYAPAPHQRGDAIVVLTGGDLRLSEAAKLLKEGRGARLLISGVNKQTTAEDLKRISGLPDKLYACCVDVDYEAHTTSGNADETRNWAEARRLKRLIVVTSSYHMPRSLTELRRTLPGIELVPHPVFSSKVLTRRWWTDFHSARVLLTEYVKFLPSAVRYGVAVLMRGDGSALADVKSGASNL